MKAKLINESLTKKDRKDQIINYSGIIDSAWRPLIQEAKDLQKISFDLENNDLIEKRIFRKKANLRIGQPVTSVIPMELWEAGGDWEWPLMYFKVCIESDHFLIGSEHKDKKEYPWDFERSEKNGGSYGGLGSKCFVIMPPRSAGNKYTECEGCKKSKFTAWQDEFPNFDKNIAKITDEDKNKAWKWIETYFDEAISKRYERIDLEENPLGMDPMDNVPEGVTPADPKNARTMEEIRNLKSPNDLNHNPTNEELLPSELLYGFAGWLTGRKTPVRMSASDDAAEPARLVAYYIDSNKLEDPRDEYEWNKELNYPDPKDYDDLDEELNPVNFKRTGSSKKSLGVGKYRPIEIGDKIKILKDLYLPINLNRGASSWELTDKPNKNHKNVYLYKDDVLIINNKMGLGYGYSANVFSAKPAYRLAGNYHLRQSWIHEYDGKYVQRL